MLLISLNDGPFRQGRIKTQSGPREVPRPPFLPHVAVEASVLSRAIVRRRSGAEVSSRRLQRKSTRVSECERIYGATDETRIFPGPKPVCTVCAHLPNDLVVCGNVQVTFVAVRSEAGLEGVIRKAKVLAVEFYFDVETGLRDFSQQQQLFLGRLPTARIKPQIGSVRVHDTFDICVLIEGRVLPGFTYPEAKHRQLR